MRDMLRVPETVARVDTRYTAASRIFGLLITPLLTAQCLGPSFGGGPSCNQDTVTLAGRTRPIIAVGVMIV